MHRLPDGVVYAVVGAGPELEAVRAAAARAGLGHRVLLGPLDDEARDGLVEAADAVVLPNIAVPGDMEGFGLVATEAALRGTPVIGARIEGLNDSVIDGVTGWLCTSGDADAFTQQVESLSTLDPSERELVRERVRAEAARRFSLERMTHDLARALDRPEPPGLRRRTGAGAVDQEHELVLQAGDEGGQPAGEPFGDATRLTAAEDRRPAVDPHLDHPQSRALDQAAPGEVVLPPLLGLLGAHVEVRDHQDGPPVGAQDAVDLGQPEGDVREVLHRPEGDQPVERPVGEGEGGAVAL
jgi:hypothetical protein